MGGEPVTVTVTVTRYHTVADGDGDGDDDGDDDALPHCGARNTLWPTVTVTVTVTTVTTTRYHTVVLGKCMVFGGQGGVNTWHPADCGLSGATGSPGLGKQASALDRSQ